MNPRGASRIEAAEMTVYDQILIGWPPEITEYPAGFVALVGESTKRIIDRLEHELQLVTGDIRYRNAGPEAAAAVTSALTGVATSRSELRTALSDAKKKNGTIVAAKFRGAVLNALQRSANDAGDVYAALEHAMPFMTGTSRETIELLYASIARQVKSLSLAPPTERKRRTGVYVAAAVGAVSVIGAIVYLMKRG